MKSIGLAILLTVALAWPAGAQTTVTGPNGGTATGGVVGGVGAHRAGILRGGTAKGPNGATASGASGGFIGPRGAGHFHVGTATAANGSTTSVQRGFLGNRQAGAMGRHRTWNGTNSSGTLQGHTTWNNGTVNSNGSVTSTNKQTGVTTTDSESVDYNKGTGGEATITTPQGTKTETLPPAP